MSRKTVREIKMLGLEKRRFPNKHYVYTLEVHWSTGATNKIYRRYSQFFEFQLALLQQFPVQGGKRNPEDRIIPFLPGKILFGRSHIRDVAEQRQGPISEYLVKLISLPHEVSESMTVTNFFEPSDEDIHPTRERAKRSVRDSEIHNISDPVLLEQWVVIGDFKKMKRSECNLKEGDVVDVIEKKATGWWFVDNAGNQGWVPASYLEAGSGVLDDEVERCGIGEEEEFITNNSYLAQNADELGFERGVIVLVLQKNYDGWWTCRYQGKEGLIPAAYLEPNTQDISKSGRSLPREKRNHTTLPTSASLNLAEVNSPRNWKSTKYNSDLNENSSVTVPKTPSALGTAVTANFIPRRESIRQTSMRKRKETKLPLDKRIPEHNIDEFVALGEFESEGADGLSFKEGDILEVVEKHDTGWWWASLRGKVGWVPSTYLEKSKTQRYSGEPSPVTMALRSNLLGLKPKRCTSKEAFKGQTQDTLAFRAGEVFEIVEKSETGWWYLKNDRGQEGWAPEDLVVEGEAVKPPRPAPVPPIKSKSPAQPSNRVTSHLTNQNQESTSNKPNAFSLENKLQLKPVSVNKPALVDKPVSVNKPALVDKPVSVNKPALVDKPVSVNKPALVDKPVSVNKPALVDKPVLPARSPSKLSIPTIPNKPLGGANKLVSLKEESKAPNKPVAPGKPSYAKVKIGDSDLDKPALPTRPRPSLIETNTPKPSPTQQASPKPSSERDESVQSQLSGVLAKRKQLPNVPEGPGKPTRPSRPVSQNMGQPKPALPARNPEKPSMPVRPSKPAEKPRPNGGRNSYVTTRDYRAHDEGCLSFRCGERAEMVEKGDTGWWWMRIRNDEGWVSEEMVRSEEATGKRAAPAAPKSNGGTLVALENYQADYDASLSFRRGDRIEVLEKDNGSGWTWVKIGREEGWAPTELIGQS